MNQRRHQQHDREPTAVAELLERSPPHDLDAEKGVLGSLLIDPSKADDVALAVGADDFYSPHHRKVYEAMLAMHNAGKQIDLKLLVAALKKTGDLEAIGGVPFLAELAGSVPIANNAVWYARIVSEKAMLRRLIEVGREMVRDGYDTATEPREVVARAESAVFGILEHSASNTDAEHVDSVLFDAMQRVDDRINNGGGIAGLTTGLKDVDAQSGGLVESELTILAARPGMGKTALATTIAELAAMRNRRGVLFVSLEMSRLELAERMLCAIARVNGHYVRTGNLSNENRRRLIEASAQLSGSPLYIDDTPSRTMTEISAVARRCKRKGDLSLIIIDYLQLIEPDNPRDPREQQVSKIARRLKGLARELKIPVLCLSQLNRQADNRSSHIPKLSDLRESGAIEQDADAVWFIHRAEYHAESQADREQLRGKADLIVAKNRHGPIGDVKLTYLAEFTRFENDASSRTYQSGRDRAAGKHDFGEYGESIT